MITELPESASDSKVKNKCFIAYIFTIDTPLGWQGVSIDLVETKEYKFLGFRCNYEGLEQLEPKNYSKTGILDEFWHFLMSFLVLAALNLDGRI